ncbi:MAG TPA: hypothetical protein VEL07_00145 [Planctomycetota bacterium]|nr:hypothetical protein [Planctomycetota bacterium]
MDATGTNQPPPQARPAPSAAAEPASRWHGRTLGGYWLFVTCAQLLRIVGVPGSWIGSWFISFPFLLFGGRFQYGSFAYWRRLRPDAGLIGLLWLMWRRYASFGRILCDRQLAFLDVKRFRFVCRDLAHDLTMRSVMSQHGAILLAAHVGNWELSGQHLHVLTGARLHMVMVRDDHPKVQAFVDQRMRPAGISVIDPRDGLGAAIGIYAALEAGDTVCMLGDRVIPGQPTITAQFLGAPAKFPMGPFHAAAITGRPIVASFLVKTGWRTYTLEVDEPYYIVLPKNRRERALVLEHAVQHWATRLEDRVRRYPLQWHNFYDFWR